MSEWQLSEAGPTLGNGGYGRRAVTRWRLMLEVG